LFEVDADAGGHYVSLWHHEELKPVTYKNRTFLPSTVDGFSRSWLDSRREGSIDCIAWFSKILEVDVRQDSLSLKADRGDKVIVWAGLPSYNCRYVEFPVGTRTISLRETLGSHEEKFVVQLFGDKELIDERVMNVPLATPRLISRVERTSIATRVPSGMVEVPAGMFKFKTTRSFLSPNEAIPYPDYSDGREVSMQKFLIDIYPVTNEQFGRFLIATSYKPKDAANFLKHWIAGAPPPGLEKHPVVNVSLDDARAYARWTGKRLPTEMEWQYAAQGTDARKYPWGDQFDSTKCNNSLGRTTAVDAFPSGRSPCGAMDLVGNVWQLTNDVYDNGSNFFGIIKGGSYYNPRASVWYVQGGPQRVDNPQILLMVGQGLDRNATVGFRCVKDVEQRP
jgi:formylglycine-generating enzyme required for sulfatase activity